MSHFTRLASTDDQEKSIRTVEQAVRESGRKIIGDTTVGLPPQSVVLDLTHHGSEITVSSDGEISFFYDGEDYVVLDKDHLIKMVKKYFNGEV